MATKTITVVLEVVKVPDFDLTTPRRRIRVVQGATAEFTVANEALPGFTADIDLDVSGLPTGVSADISPDPVAPHSPAVISIDTDGMSGEYPLEISGTGVAEP